MNIKALVCISIIGCLLISSGVNAADYLDDEDVFKLELADKRAHQNLDATAMLNLIAPNFKFTQPDGKEISIYLYAVAVAQRFDLASHYLSKRSNHKVEYSADRSTAVLTFDQTDKLLLKKNKRVIESSGKVTMYIGLVDGEAKIMSAKIEE